MERKTKDVCIKVDNKQFVLHPASQMTLDGVLAYIDVGLQTGKWKELNTGMLHLLRDVMAQSNDSIDKCEGGW